MRYFWKIENGIVIKTIRKQQKINFKTSFGTCPLKTKNTEVFCILAYIFFIVRRGKEERKICGGLKDKTI
jgi:hypothetical protein